jgi:hypothetical protein
MIYAKDLPLDREASLPLYPPTIRKLFFSLFQPAKSAIFRLTTLVTRLFVSPRDSEVKFVAVERPR